jgi:uncharacterized protein (TIGR02246 family)
MMGSTAETTTARNKAVVQRINDAFARNDVEAFLAECSDDLVWTMVGEQPVKGKDAIRKWMGSAPAEPPTFTIDHVVAEGDFVTVIGDMTMQEDGRTVPYSYCDVWRFQGDRPVELKAFVIKRP